MGEAGGGKGGNGGGGRGGKESHFRNASVSPALYADEGSQYRNTAAGKSMTKGAEKRTSVCIVVLMR